MWRSKLAYRAGHLRRGKHEKYIIETTGTGVAIFDYDNDGWPDIFVVNGRLSKPREPVKDRRAISITTIMTARSPTSPQRPV